MINIDTLKKNLHYLANKHQTGASITPDEFNEQIPHALYYVLRRILGLPEFPEPLLGYEKIQMMTDYVDELKISDVNYPVNSKGQATLPSDMLYYADIYIYYKQAGTYPQDDLLQDHDISKLVYPTLTGSNCDPIETTPVDLQASNKQTLKTLKMQTPVEVVTSNVFSTRRQHSIRVPALEYPIACFTGNKGIKFAPENILKYYITYIKRPVTPLWGYTVDPLTDEAIYDAFNSVNIELPEELTDMLTANMLTRLGYSVRETELYTIADKINKTGS